jgi:hypothetical protein
MSSTEQALITEYQDLIADLQFQVERLKKKESVMLQTITSLNQQVNDQYNKCYDC